MSFSPSTQFRTDIRPQIPYQGLHGRDGVYLADPGLIDAANVALTLGLPLLLTGEPGCGKSDFAFVVANALARLDSGAQRPHPGADPEPLDDSTAAALDPGRALECHIRSDSRARDLLYHYDAILRFTDGHHGGDAGRARAEDARHYIELQALGIALTSPVRRVVLIDEIDKAQRDLPNDLLRELDRGEFEIAEIPARAAGGDVVRDRTGVPLTRVMRKPEKAPGPMVVITSNVERQLPDPFLRRCVFYHIEFPDQDRLRQIARLRFPEHPSLLLDAVVRIFEHARGIPDLVKRPSTAELLNWAGALALFQDVYGIIAEFDEHLDAHGVAQGRLGWSDLPAVGCLFKLHEDLRKGATWGARPRMAT